MDIAIVDTCLITMSGKGVGLINDGAIGITGDRITFIGKTKELNQREADIIIDGSYHATLPGLINSHIHTGETLLRGGAQDLPEIEWMNKGLGPFAKHLTSDDKILGSKLGVLEGIRSGTTTFSEYTRHATHLIKEVFLPFNVRVVATETINEVSSDRSLFKPTDIYVFNRDQGDSDFKRASQLFEEYKDVDLVSTLYGPQALDMISLDLLQEIKQQAEERNSKIHMHIAQGQRERIQIKGRYGADTTTVKVLENHKMLDNRVIAVHLHDSSPEERSLLVKRGASMVGCPSSISLIDGIVPPVSHYIEIGGVAAIGTDQAPGPGHHNMFREMRAASFSTKIIQKNPTALPAWQALKLATMNGASVLGLEQEIGSLEVGKKADVITIDLNNANLIPIVSKPFNNVIPNLIYSMNGNEVDNVIIDGKIVLKDNKFTNIEENSILKEANNRAKVIFEEGTEDWVKADSKMVSYRKNGFI